MRFIARSKLVINKWSSYYKQTYQHIFDSLAVNGEKPRLYALDERYFAAQNEFEITYEAVEQIARHAHTIVPETHSNSPEYFDLKFTN